MLQKVYNLVPGTNFEVVPNQNSIYPHLNLVHSTNLIFKDTGWKLVQYHRQWVRTLSDDTPAPVLHATTLENIFVIIPVVVDFQV